MYFIFCTKLVYGDCIKGNVGVCTYKEHTEIEGV